MAFKHPALTRKDVFDAFMNIPQPDDVVICDYVLIDGTSETENMKCISYTMNYEPNCVEDCPTKDFDGRAASFISKDAEKDFTMYAIPVALFKDPFRRGRNKIVLCEAHTDKREPHPVAKRTACKKVMDQVKEHHPWFGIEQEYALLDVDGYPFGWPKLGYPEPQGPHWNGVGITKVYGRDVAEAHARACLFAGVKLSGWNSEFMPAQWEFQVGPCEGIEAGDQLWIARYLLMRIVESFGISVTLDPKPTRGNWMSSGAHTNYSTKEMRQEGGLRYIHEAIEKLSKRHKEHLEVYDPHGGKDNERRLKASGSMCLRNMDDFISVVGDKKGAVRIPLPVHSEGKGYFEDRRPSSNCDPYAVMKALVETTLL